MIPRSNKTSSSSSSSTANIPCQCDVVIVGAGIAGASAAYHLSQSTNDHILVLERGQVGEGLPGEEKASGTNVMPSLRTVKQITHLYATSSTNFISHHGKEGARRYLQLSKLGMKYQKDLASRLLPFPKTQLRCLGALYLTYDTASIPELEEEFELLQELGCSDIEFWGKPKLLATPGCPPLAEAAIFLPEDAIIDSAQYAQCLLAAAVARGNVQVFSNCPEVTKVWTEHTTGTNTTAITELSNSARIVSQHCVVATGGFFLDSTLAGILTPAWSYLVGIPHPELSTIHKKDVIHSKSSTESSTLFLSDGTPYNSCNFYTWGFTHDWCWTEGSIRVSGEDHFSAFKPPRTDERCRSLSSWIGRSYPTIFPHDDPHPEHLHPFQCGVYSETPDSCPLVGHIAPNSRICYIVGCNAWGQSCLSYCATLIPALLKYADLDDTQRNLLRLVTIRRFSLLPSVFHHNNVSRANL